MAIWRKVPKNEVKNECENENGSTVTYDPITGYTFRANTITVNENNILEKEKEDMKEIEEMTVNENNNLKVISPWAEYAKKIQALFERDLDVEVKYNNDVPEVLLYVIGSNKAQAISKILPETVNFGSIDLKVTVITDNDLENATPDILFREAFLGNPAFSFSSTVGGISSNPFTYVAFKPEVVQYHNDDISDAYGNRSTLYQQLAKEVFNDIPGVYFCTDKVENQ